MKRFLKSSFSIFLAITMIFSSAYVGLNEIDFNGIFAVKAEAASVSDLTFTLNDDSDSYSVTGCNKDAYGVAIIPSTYKGLPVTSIGDYAFRGCASLTSITIPDSVTSIGDYAFYECTSLTSITIPDGVTSIGDRAFCYCSSLTSITIPASVTSIGSIYGCTSLTSINVNEDNDYYSSVNGVFFNKDKTVLRLYPSGRTNTSYTVPNGVTSIGNCCGQAFL